MRGDKAAGLWGWGDTARRMQTLLNQGGADARDRYENRYYEARYNLTRCNLELGLAQTGAKKTEALETAKTQVVSFVAITSDFSEEWWPKFDNIYREIQTGLGLIPEPLEKPKEYVAVTEPEKVPSNGSSDKKPKKPKGKSKVKKADDDGTMTYAIFGIIALLGLGGGGFMVMKGTKTRKPSAAMASVTIDPPVIAPPPAATPRKKRSAAPQKGKAATQKPAAAGEKPKRPLTPEEKEKIRRRRAAKAKAEQEAKKKAGGE